LAGARAGEWEEVSLAGAEEEVGSAVADGGLILMLMVWALTWRECLTVQVLTPQRGCLTGLVLTTRREHPTTRPIVGIRRGEL
jgi:hypothetical protein